MISKLQVQDKLHQIMADGLQPLQPFKCNKHVGKKKCFV